MKFCPRCGRLMVPSNEGSRRVLVCPQCKYTLSLSELSRSDAAGYVVKHRVEEEKRVKMAVVKTGERRMSEEERQLLEDYYKLFLELVESQERSSEEAGEE